MSTLTLRGPDLSHWDPENESTWDRRLAWRTLWITTYNLTLAFCVWYLVSAIAPRLNDIGYDLTTGQLYWLAAIPGLSAGLARLVYMFLPPVVGTRTLVGGSATLLLLPMVGWVLAVRDPGTPYAVLLLLAAASGIGGGAFAGFMPSTSYFFPRRMAGTALGLQAGIGNFGVSLIQLLVPWVVGFGLLGTAALTPQQRADGSSIWLHNAGLVLIPWVLLGMVLARRLAPPRPGHGELPAAARHLRREAHLVHDGRLPHDVRRLLRLRRPDGPAHQEHVRGHGGRARPAAVRLPRARARARSRARPGVRCATGSAVRSWSLRRRHRHDGRDGVHRFLPRTDRHRARSGCFLGGMLTIFMFAGIGNAGTFKQMPMIFERRRAGGVIGFTSAIAAFGPFLVGVGLSLVAPQAFFIGAAVYFALCTVLVWRQYARPGAPRPS